MYKKQILIFFYIVVSLSSFLYAFVSNPIEKKLKLLNREYKKELPFNNIILGSSRYLS